MARGLIVVNKDYRVIGILTGVCKLVNVFAKKSTIAGEIFMLFE